MRKKESKNGVSVKAYAGTTGVLLGMNVEPGRRPGLLGFALERLDGSSGEKEWLQAILPFPGTERRPGELLPTNVAPVQRFRWSDYRVYPDTVYSYTVHSVYGSPAEPEVDPTWALDVAIYEYELPEIVEAVNAARARGAKVRVVYHAKEGDEQTEENEHNLATLPPEAKRARLTSRICHHKFMVLSRLSGGTRKPRAVLYGSTNFTHNGVYRQANVVHVVRREDIAQEYLDLFEVLFGGADVTTTRRYVTENNPIDASQPLFAGFSPRSGGADLEAFIAHIDAARRDVLFCTTFDLYDGVEEVLLGEAHDPILRLGLQNSRSQITGYHRDRTADFVATAMIPEGLEGYLEETTAGQRGNILIHTKLVVVDFTSENPTIISGSHNLSKAASEGNDENFLIVHDNTDVADCYGCELMRLYDHYRFRWYLKEGTQQEPAALREDDSWTEPYFTEGSLEENDRLRFAGEAV